MTTSEMLSNGFERVRSRGQRRDLVNRRDCRVRLTDGVDGFGRQTNTTAVVLLVRDDERGGWRVHDRIAIATAAVFCDDAPRAMGSGPGLCVFAKTADIESATESLLKQIDAVA